MKEVGSLQGEAMALSGIAKASEYLANMGKACEALEAVSCWYCYAVFVVKLKHNDSFATWQQQHTISKYLLLEIEVYWVYIVPGDWL